jgi:hypothetical protein
LENQSTTRNTKKVKFYGSHTTLLSPFFPFWLLTKHQQNTNPNTTYLQAHKQIRQNSASLLEISQKEKRTHFASKHEAQEIGESMARFCEIADFVSWKALPEENEICWRESAR